MVEIRGIEHCARRSETTNDSRSCNDDHDLRTADVPALPLSSSIFSRFVAATWQQNRSLKRGSLGPPARPALVRKSATISGDRFFGVALPRWLRIPGEHRVDSRASDSTRSSLLKRGPGALPVPPAPAAAPLARPSRSTRVRTPSTRRDGPLRGETPQPWAARVCQASRRCHLSPDESAAVDRSSSGRNGYWRGRRYRANPCSEAPRRS